MFGVRSSSPLFPCPSPPLVNSIPAAPLQPWSIMARCKLRWTFSKGGRRARRDRLARVFADKLGEPITPFPLRQGARAEEQFHWLPFFFSLSPSHSVSSSLNLPEFRSPPPFQSSFQTSSRLPWPRFPPLGKVQSILHQNPPNRERRLNSRPIEPSHLDSLAHFSLSSHKRVRSTLRLAHIHFGCL